MSYTQSDPRRSSKFTYLPPLDGVVCVCQGRPKLPCRKGATPKEAFLTVTCTTDLGWVIGWEKVWEKAYINAYTDRQIHLPPTVTYPGVPNLSFDPDLS